jgi:hypothetical protein
MRLTTWNCSPGTDIDRCLAETESLRSDLLTLQQCRKPVSRQPPVIWRGGSAVQGIAMLSRRAALPLTPLVIPYLHHNVVPVLVHAMQPFLLVGVWTHGCYNEVARTALETCVAAVVNLPIVVAGSFYSSPAPSGQSRSRALMREMRDDFGLVSAYHSHRGPGQEVDTPGAGHLWREDEPFHLTYCFVSEGLVGRVTGVEFGRAGAGTESHHRPLTVTLEV